MSKVVICDVCGENRPGFNDPEGWMKLFVPIQEFEDAEITIQSFDICSPTCLANVAASMLEDELETYPEEREEEQPQPQPRKRRLEPLPQATAPEPDNGRRPLTEEEIEALTGVVSRTGKKRGI